jgi:N-acetylmuramoyl-L-alanine amidase
MITNGYFVQRLRFYAAAVLVSAVCAAPANAQLVRPKAAPPAPQCDAGKFRLILDVGHTPEIPGAISARGDTEYNFNLRLANVIKQRLEAAGFVRTTLLLGTGEAIPSLVRRVSQANAMSADLLLSIHHDSVPQFFKSKWNYEGKDLEYSDRFKGHSIFVSKDNANYQQSLAFAQLLGGRLKARGMQYTPHYTEPFMGSRQRMLLDAENGVYRFDQLVILRTAHMPSVLLEAGSIVNRDEEVLMGTQEHQLEIAGAVTEAVEKFCAQNMTRTAKVAAPR